MQHYETIHTESREGFDIVFSVTHEDAHPRDLFEDFDLPDVLDGIESGRFEWFIARVQAFKCGVELASDYLGGCLYDSAQKFVDSNDYYADMVQNVIIDARKKINLLTEKESEAA